jgi:succinate dehydrogenase / fumarate reductase cytochrome b subunit
MLHAPKPLAKNRENIMASPYPKAPKRNRPKNLNLLTIRLPIPALVSIMHRVSGAFLFMLLPVLLWVLHQSLANDESYQLAQAVLNHPLAKLIFLAVTWAYLHHAFAGIRHLALDAHYGLRLNFARATSRAVLIVSGLLTLRMGIWLW